MSSGCGDVLSLADLQTAKKHQIFEAEVITGKQGGATNQVTGQTQKTMPAILRDLGFRAAAFTFTTGGTLAVGDTDVAVLWPVSSGGDGDYYHWKGVYPKTIPANSTPASTGGVSQSGWMPVGDITLRSDLASPDVGKGDALVKVRQPLTGAVARTQHDKNMDAIYVTDSGAVGDGATDNFSAFSAAITAALANDKVLRVPSGEFLISADLNVTMPTGSNFKLVGEGSAHSILAFDGATNGLNITTTGSQEWDAASVHVQSLTLTTTSVNVGTALTVNQMQVTGIPAGNVTLSDLQIRGKTLHSQQWATGISIQRTTGTTLRDIEVYGYAHSGLGVGISLRGTADDIVTQHIIDNCRLWFLDVALTANEFIQGIFLTNSNVFNCNHGLVWDAGAETNGQTELHVVNCQMTFTYDAINLTRIGFIVVNSSMFIGNQGTASMVILRLDSCFEYSITNNNFYGGTNVNNIGIEVAATYASTANMQNYPGIVYGNTFDALAEGVHLSSSAQGLRLSNNVYTASVTTQVVNSSGYLFAREDVVFNYNNVITFATTSAVQTITVNIPAGVFATTPGQVALHWNGDYVMSGNYSIADSSTTSLVFKVRRFDGATFTGGPFAYSIRACR